MRFWLDEHLSPLLVPWIIREFRVEVSHVRTLSLARARDREIFHAARAADVVLMTKDADFH